MVVPVVVGLAFGTFAALSTARSVAYCRIPPFIATLGMMLFAAASRSGGPGQPGVIPDRKLCEDRRRHDARGHGSLSLAVVFHLIMNYTVYGKHTYAIGSNEAAARMSGINVPRHMILVYMIAGMLAGFAAVILTSKNLTAQSGMGLSYELDAIAMAVIGGVSLFGGRGSIIGTVIGALIIGVITSGFTFSSLVRSIRKWSGLHHRRRGCAGPMATTTCCGAGIRRLDMSDIILETEDLTKHYGGVHALEGANFDLRKGEHVAIMGDNGAGKSTFVRQITGVEQRTRGKVSLTAKRSALPARLMRARQGSRPCSKPSPWPMIWTCLTTCSWGAKRPN